MLAKFNNVSSSIKVSNIINTMTNGIFIFIIAGRTLGYILLRAYVNINVCIHVIFKDYIYLCGSKKIKKKPGHTQFMVGC